MIRGIIEVPPKLVKPILAKARKSWNNVLIMLFHPHPDKAQHGTADHQHQITDGRKQADAESRKALPEKSAGDAAAIYGNTGSKKTDSWKKLWIRQIFMDCA